MLSIISSTLLIIFVIFLFPPPDSLAKKFGLTPEQFGENLRDSYQRHETEQFPAEPLELAKDYVCRSVCGDPRSGPADDLGVFSSPSAYCCLFSF